MIHFTDTITLGAIIIGIVVALLGLLILLRGGYWKSTAEVYREGRDAYKGQAERLKAELNEAHTTIVAATETIGEQKETIAKLEALPNLQKILETIGDMSVKQDAAADRRAEGAVLRMEKFVTDQLASHEQRAQQRHDAQMAVMETMVEKLNGGRS